MSDKTPPPRRNPAELVEMPDGTFAYLNADEEGVQTERISITPQPPRRKRKDEISDTYEDTY